MWSTYLNVEYVPKCGVRTLMWRVFVKIVLLVTRSIYYAQEPFVPNPTSSAGQQENRWLCFHANHSISHLFIKYPLLCRLQTFV